jgi:two-component system phosphate regulon sensor histidine kinase PhoR
MENNAIKRLIAFGVFVIIGIIAAQSYWFYKTLDFKMDEFDKTVRIALLQVAENLAAVDSFQIPAIDLVKKASSNYYVVNINNVIDARNLEYYLQKEFQESAITEDFEYGIFNCSSDEMVYGSYCSYSEKSSFSKSVNLPKYDEFIYYFGVRFPNRTSFVLGRMQLEMFLTAILLLTILFFANSIFVILRQKRLSEMQKEFINNMTHEFKTPISTINVSADVFLGSEAIQNDPRLSRYAAIVKEQNNRLNGQVEKVLQIARLEQQDFKLNIEQIALNELLEEIAKTPELKAQNLGGSFVLNLGAKQTDIKADRFHLTNILHNLLDNSLKYCAAAPLIQLSTKDKGANILLEISDNGIGIAPEHQARIFDKFYRVPTGNVHNVKGFGLGLFYVKGIVDAHGWTIACQSELGKGTTIAITIKR